MIGMTATIPVEIVFAAGRRPVDLNNLFITSDSPGEFIAQAESDRFSHNTCAWIKGIYAAVVNLGIHDVIAVTGGDCSNTIALSEVLRRKGVRIFTFEYPLIRGRAALQYQMDGLRKALNTTWHEIETSKSILDRIRTKLRRLDELTWQENVVTGLENHQFLVSSSDFGGDPVKFEHEVETFLLETEKRSPIRDAVRLGYIGVPPIFSRFYEFLESLGARVVFNEVQRQFSMPYDHTNIVDQYLAFTYPYDIDGRLKDIKKAVVARRLDGLIHYTQMFCYRQLYDVIIRDELDIPILTLEGDRPGKLDARTALRIETFVEMIKGRKYG